MMSQMQDMMRQQQQLLDRSFRRSRSGQQQKHAGRRPGQQQALRQMLDQMMQQMRQQGGGVPQAMQRAERSMRGAGRRWGRTSRARRSDRKATPSMRCRKRRAAWPIR